MLANLIAIVGRTCAIVISTGGRVAPGRSGEIY